MKLIGIISLIVLSLWLMYSLLSTVVIRTLSLKVIRNLGEAEGVLLTFDDGPHPEYTLELLKLLKEYNVRAVFFIVGELAEKYPGIIKQMHAEGHMLGIHHYQHKSNWSLLPHQTKEQITRTKGILEQIIGEEIVLYRPPWGHFNLTTLLSTKSLQTLMWSHIYKDWKVEDHYLEKLLKEPAEAGSILLLHDNGDTKGAEDTAPLEMMDYLRRYLIKMQEENLPFAEPQILLKRKES